MKILITNYHLRDLAGSELFTFNLAKELKKRGHQVFVFAPFLGAVAEKIRKYDILVTDDILSLKNESIDIVHAQHNVTAILARSVFLKTPMVYMSHGILPDLEQPPSVELNISRFIVVSEEIKEHLINRHKIKSEKIEIIRNFVDADRFKQEKSVGVKPKKLLVLSNHYVDKVKNVIETACKELGIDVFHIGLPENPVDNVEDYINEADIVVTLGRGALEAMACGRNVIIYDMHGGDGFVDEKNFFEIRKNNFSGRRFAKKYSVEDLKKEILKYDKSTAQKLRKIVLRENSKTIIVDNFEAHYRNVLGVGCFVEKKCIEKEGLIREFCIILDQVRDTEMYNCKKLGTLSSENEKLKKMVKSLDCEIREKEKVIQQKNIEIELIKSSKFWKLRNKYLKLKKYAKRK